MIARRLDITESTVKVHVKHMLKNEVKIPRRSRRLGASGAHFLTYSSGSNFHRGSSAGIATSGCTTESVISLRRHAAHPYLPPRPLAAMRFRPF